MSPVFHCPRDTTHLLQELSCFTKDNNKTLSRFQFGNRFPFFKRCLFMVSRDSERRHLGSAELI